MGRFKEILDEWDMKVLDKASCAESKICCAGGQKGFAETLRGIAHRYDVTYVRLFCLFRVHCPLKILK
jgi:hypothetical protein